MHALPENKRIPSIDRFRGFALALMIIFGASQSLAVSPVLLGLSTHDLTKATLVMPSLAFYDLIAPLFVFAFGLSLSAPSSPLRKVSLKTHFRKVFSLLGLGAAFTLPDGKPLSFVFLSFSIIAIVLVCLWIIGLKTKKINRKKVSSVLRNFILFVGIFAFVTAIVENGLFLAGKSVSHTHWSVLGSIGFALLLVFPIKKLNVYAKLTFCAVFTALYFACNFFIPQENFVFFTHGGLLGSFGWALLGAYALAAADLRKISPVSALSFGAILCTLGFILNEYFLPSKSAVNLTYVLLTSSLGLLVFAFFDCFNGIKTRYSPLSVAGKNSLLLYMTHLVIFVPAGTVINALVGLIPVGTVLLTIIAFCALIAYFLILSLIVEKLNKKGFFVTIK